TLVEIHGLPTPEQPALSKGEFHVIRGRNVFDRGYRPQECIERSYIRIADLGEVRIGKYRIQLLPMLANALPQGPSELRLTPLAYACFRIGGDVRRIDDPKRGMEIEAPGERRASCARMTTYAVSGESQISSPLHERCVRRLAIAR